jgi:hypothetical protein
MNHTSTTKQIIKASSWHAFMQKLERHGDAVSFRHMAYFGLWHKGAVLDVVDSWQRVAMLRLGDQLDLSMSPDTASLDAALVSSIHLVGEAIVINGSDHLFTYPQAEELFRAMAAWMRRHEVKNVIFGGAPEGCGSWVLPAHGAPICLSSEGWGWVLPHEGTLFARERTSGACCLLSAELFAQGCIGRQHWLTFYVPLPGHTVIGMGQRVRDGFIYATIKRGEHTGVEAWDVRPLRTGGPVVTSALRQASGAWTSENDLLGPLVSDLGSHNTVAWIASHASNVTLYGAA